MAMPMCCKLLAVSAAALLVLAVPALGNTFYVSSSTGSDANPGTQAQPWQTLAKVESAALAPGDAVAFRRGDTWTGSLTIARSGTSTGRITFYGYGTSSSRPLITGSAQGVDCVSVQGSFVMIDNLWASACGYAGFTVAGHDVTVKNSKADLNAVGVRVKPGTSNVLVTKNVLTNNNVLNENTSTSCSGAFGVLLNGPGVVTYNTISGSFAPCQAYGWDGSGVEIFNASNAWVHHNTITNSDSGVEEGGTGSANAIEYNKIQSATSDPRAVGIVLPGSQTNAWLAHNSIRTVGGRAQGIVCYTTSSATGDPTPCASTTTLRDNAVKADSKALFLSGSGQTVEHNVFNGAVEGITLSTSNSTAPVRFASDSNLHLTAASPAIDRGTIANFPTDLDGNRVPYGPAPDAGAYEFRPT